ncbi:MAG: hypothetical protein A2Y25_03375 [Candidatus Melainabacteria bacterium GWF2_37_15]|nr:MAG: hypothetical protein A2Y25_03375 [Candidatus Melainabacteria bacterium GWF2_37_15]
MDDPLKWLEVAKSNLKRGEDNSYLDLTDIRLEELCFDLQQCAEKSLKAILIKNKIQFPKTHNIVELLVLIKKKLKITIPDDIKEAAILTDYAVTTRYPCDYNPVSEKEYEEAVKIARRVYMWAKMLVE